jgi:hypothetical protein
MGFKETSDLIAVSFGLDESAANTFTQTEVQLALNALDNEIAIVYAIDLNPSSPDALAGINTAVRSSVSSTSLTAMGDLSNTNVLAVSQEAIRAAGFVDGGVGFTRIAGETPDSRLPYVGIISTSNFFVQIEGGNNGAAKAVNGRLWMKRAKADASTYAALVQSEVLSA